MKYGASTQYPQEPKIMELRSIRDKYQPIIENNPILRSDFDDLLKALQESGPPSQKYCNGKIDHLVFEIDEIREDNQRMDDESPSCKNGIFQSDKQFREHQNLKQALETYRSAYIGA